MSKYCRKLIDELDELNQMLENLPEDSEMRKNVQNRIYNIEKELSYRGQLKESTILDNFSKFEDIVEDDIWVDKFWIDLGKWASRNQDQAKKALQESLNTTGVLTEVTFDFKNSDKKIPKQFLKVYTMVQKQISKLNNVDISEVKPEESFTGIQQLINKFYGKDEEERQALYQLMQLGEGKPEIIGGE